ncbi:hypothetical protein llap_6642 [Limosa lapponica baueri]|uniref:Uncharacterized protein n=1 Tax=Limosa lapponica baueri TaxID=1758121 RepID=A0A2I0UAI4_LIMLA|nr:hypothetical protein llap_6642 [Limosa lapponica baueri]
MNNMQRTSEIGRKGLTVVIDPTKLAPVELGNVLSSAIYWHLNGLFKRLPYKGVVMPNVHAKETEEKLKDAVKKAKEKTLKLLKTYPNV